MLNAAYLTTALRRARGRRALSAGEQPHETKAAPWCAWRSACSRCWRRCNFSSATSTGSTRCSTSRSRSPPWRRIGTARKPGDFHIFAWPDEKAETNRFAISIPHGASLILTHRSNGLFPGLKSVPPHDRPPVMTVFFAFRIMLGIGFLMIAPALFGALLWWRGTLFETRWYLRIVAHSWWIGFVAVIAGWVVTESGRQPWIVLRHPAHRRRDLAGLGRNRADDAGAVRHRLRHRVRDGHLLHQPPDRARAARRRVEPPAARRQRRFAARAGCGDAKRLAS